MSPFRNQYQYQYFGINIWLTDNDTTHYSLKHHCMYPTNHFYLFRLALINQIHAKVTEANTEADTDTGIGISASLMNIPRTSQYGRCSVSIN